MSITYNSATGLWEEEDPITGMKKPVPLMGEEPQWQDTTLAERSAMRVLPYRLEEQMAAQREQAEYARALGAGEGQTNRPMFAQGPGQFLRDLGRVSVNMPLGLATDVADLATTAVKLSPVGMGVTALMDLAQGRQPDAGRAFTAAIDESQNPLTVWRREALRPETQAGQFASNLLRLATPSKLLTAPLKAVGVLSKLDDVARFANADALQAVKLRTPLRPAAAEAIRAIENAPRRRMAFKEIAEAAKTNPLAMGVKNRWQALEVQRAALKANLGIGSKGSDWIRSAGEFVGWDLFMAYNVAGEGDEELDETLGDALSDWFGIGNPLATDYTDNALTLKLKQMGDALIGGTLVGGAIELFRVQRYARNFQRATPSEQRKILKLFDQQAEDIGMRVTTGWNPRPLLPTSNVTLRSSALARLPENETVYPVWRQRLDEVGQRLQGAREVQRQALPSGFARLQGSDDLVPLPGSSPDQGLLPSGPDLLEGSTVPPSLPGSGLNRGLLTGADPDLLEGSGDLIPLPGAGPNQRLLTAAPPFELKGSEPVIEPADWLALAREAFSRGTGESELQRLMAQLNDLLPQERANLVDFIERMTPTRNELNLLPAPEAFAVNRLMRQGVAEGWAEFDQNFNLVIRRKRAIEMDLADLDAAAGRDFDEVMRLRRTKEETQNNLIRQALDEMDQRATDELAVEEGVDSDGLDMRGEFERFLQDNPGGDVDEFRAWLQEQDQLEWFLTKSQRSGRVPPASELDPIKVPTADVRDGEIPETTPRSAPPDPLDAEIAAAEGRAEASRQRANQRLAQEAQAEQDLGPLPDAPERVLRGDPGLTDLDRENTAAVAAKLEQLRQSPDPGIARNASFAQKFLLTDRKRANRLELRKKYDAEVIESEEFVSGKLSDEELNRRYPNLLAWEADETAWTAELMEKGGKYVQAQVTADPLRLISRRYYTLDKIAKWKNAEEALAEATDHRLSKLGEETVEKRLKERYGDWPGPRLPKYPKALEELDNDQWAREFAAKRVAAEQEEALADGLADFANQLADNGGEICFP